MARELKLPKEFARVFMAGLIHVCRADGRIVPTEIDELQRVARRIGLKQLDGEQLLEASEMSPEALAAAIRLAIGSASPYRSEPLPNERTLKQGFLEAAFDVAAADGEIVTEELALLREIALALGLPPRIGTIRFGSEADPTEE